jgi:hypothetical protein
MTLSKRIFHFSIYLYRHVVQYIYITKMEFCKAYHKLCETTHVVSGMKIHIHTLYNKVTLSIIVFVSQHEGMIHILAVTAFFQP